MNKVTKMGMGAVGLLLFFAACEKEISVIDGGGKKVPILFSVEPTGYNTEDEMVRKGGVGEPVTSTIPLDEEFCLQATLVPDTDEELRGPKAFKEGQKLCFEAYLAEGTHKESAVYTYSSGKWTSSAPLGVEPDNSTMYRFVAYSYYEDTATPDASGLDLAKDLVWGKSADTKIQDTEAGRTVTINMTHKFAQVRVWMRSSNITATTNITTLSGVQIEGRQQASLNPFSGDVTYSGTANQNINMGAPPASNNIYSTYRVVTPVSPGPIRVKIGSLSVTGSSAFPNKTLDISSTLSVGTSYTLLVDLKRMSKFAYSNIVWDGSKLTFATTAAENSTVAAGNVQGVYFRWGSLVAISPAITTYTAAQYPSGSILFSPKGVYNYAYNSIPYIDDATYPFDNAEDTDDDFATYNNGTGFDAATDKGDICRYITSRSTWVSGSWRLPKASEFQALIAEQTPSFQGPWTQISTNNNGNGTLQIGSTVQLGIGGALTFPASGLLFPDKGVGSVGIEGFACTGSSYGINTLCRQLFILRPNVMVEATFRSRELGIPVRCIRVS